MIALGVSVGVVLLGVVLGLEASGWLLLLAALNAIAFMPRTVPAEPPQAPSTLTGDLEEIKDAVSAIVSLADHCAALQAEGEPTGSDPKNLLAAANYLNLKLTARDVLFGAKQTMPLVFSDSAARIVGVLGRRAAAKGLSINNRIGIELRALAEGDPQFLETAFFLVLDQAVRATPEGTMTIDAHWSGDGHLAVSIVEATLPASTETLDLVAQALTARGGALDYRREPNTWRIDLPLVLPRKAQVTGGLAESLGRIVILAGQPSQETDAWQDFAQISDAITSWGLRVEVRPNVASAATLAMALVNEGEPPPAVLLYQPGLSKNGRELLDVVRGHKDMQQVRFVLIMPRDAHGDWKRRYVKAGFHKVLPYPLEISALYAAVVEDGAKPGDGKGVTSLNAFRRARETFHNLSVIVASPDGWSQVALRQILERAGNNVVVVSTGVETLKALERHRFDIGIFALRMPMMEGQPDADTMHFTRPLGLVMPIILLKRAGEDAGDEIETPEVDAVMQTPVDAASLLRMVADVIEAREKRDGSAPSNNPPVVVVDFSLLQDLTKLSFADSFVVDIIDGFFRDVERLLSQLEDKQASGDWDNFSRTIVSIKGCASSVGARTLADRCKEFAALPLEEAEAKAPAIREELIALYNASRETMLEFRAARAGE